MSEIKLASKRVFINLVDSYIGLNLANYLSTCIVGSTLDDDEPEEEATDEIEGFISKKNSEALYEIHGTLKNKNSKQPISVKAILKYDTREEFFEHIVESDVIVYDIIEDINQIEEALYVANALHDHFQWLEKEIIFILLSSIMTWAKTKSNDDDEEMSFNDEDYRRRKPHPNFKDHFNAEKEILKLSKKHKSKIKMYVLSAGILYGEGEMVFHNFFKQSWNNIQELIIYDKGTNIIPTIHVKDLAGIIQNIADSKPANKYILAVDDSKSSLEDIAKIISQKLSSGKVKKVPKEQILMENVIQTNDLEIFLVNLRLEALIIKEMKIKWVAETGFVENIDVVINEYKLSRNLLPIKVCILGPPCTGKTYYSNKLANKYQLKNMKINEVISDYMKYLEAAITYPSIVSENIEKEKHKILSQNDEDTNPDFGAEELEEAEAKAVAAKEIQEKLLHNLTENQGKLYDEDLTMIYKEILQSKECQNHGFVLDGFPETKEQAKLLFSAENDEEENVKNLGYNPIITPQHVFVLKLSDKNLEIQNSILKSNDLFDENYGNRLKTYRSINDDLEEIDEETVLSFFDFREIHPIILQIQEDFSKDGEENRINILNEMYYELGEPHTYGPNEEEKILINLQEQEAAKQQMLIELENKKIKDAEMLTIRKHNQSEWNENLELVKQQQYEYLETHDLPLRNYLMHLVMPVLTDGLMDCSQVRTEDPIDYLSEFILRYGSRKNNAEKK